MSLRNFRSLFMHNSTSNIPFEYIEDVEEIDNENDTVIIDTNVKEEPAEPTLSTLTSKNNSLSGLSHSEPEALTFDVGNSTPRNRPKAYTYAKRKVNKSLPIGCRLCKGRLRNLEDFRKHVGRVKE